VEIQKDGELLKFDKLLLNQAASKTIIIKNTGMIGAKWRLSGLDHPEEFKVVNTAGELAPTQEARIDVTFKAIKERKVVHKLVLEVEDVE
jgi:hydrocephalus-inducing protein